MSTPEQSKTLVREWLHAVIETGDDECVRRLMASDCIDHDPAPGQLAGRQGHIEKMAYVRSVFSERRLLIQHLIAEGDYVVDHWTFEGIHSGSPFLGIEATGAHVRFSGIDIVRIERAQIVEMWHVEDFFSAVQQLAARS